MQKVSIIVPVYNTEKYLRRCFDSLINQKYRCFEIIVIDDGSKDNSGRICDEYAEKYSEFYVYHIQNGGVSNARNIGISKAKGKYLTFVDSDDYIYHDFLSELITFSHKDFDLIQSGLSYFNEHSSELTMERLTYKEFDLNIKEDCLALSSIKLITSPCCKLYKRSLIVSNNLKFDTSISFGEDRDFNIRLLSHINTAIALPYVGYKYRRGITSSLSQDSKYEKLFIIDLDYWQNLYAFLEEKGCIELSKTYLVSRLYHIYNDRLSQIISSKQVTIFKIYTIVKQSLEYKTFEWLSKNINLIDKPSLIFYAFKYKSVLLASLIYFINKNKSYGKKTY